MVTENKKFDFTLSVLGRGRGSNTELKVVKDELCLNVGFEISMWFQSVELDLAVQVLQRKGDCLVVCY